jgi:hypothetical protein
MQSNMAGVRLFASDLTCIINLPMRKDVLRALLPVADDGLETEDKANGMEK